MLTLQRADDRIVIARGPSAAGLEMRRLLGADERTRDVLVLPDLGHPSGAAVRASAGDDGALGTGDDFRWWSIVRPGGALTAGHPLHPSFVAMMDATTVQTVVHPGRTSILDSPTGDAVHLDIGTLGAVDGIPVMAGCLAVGEHRLFLAGAVGDAGLHHALATCADATVVWLDGAALEQLAGADGSWSAPIPADATVVISPDESDGCGPPASLVARLAPRAVYWIVPLTPAFLRGCQDRFDWRPEPFERVTEGLDGDVGGPLEARWPRRVDPQIR